MANIVVVGAQWGDEGKGKITDLLARKADGVIRYQGGPNAGHTVVVGDETFKLHTIPSGILTSGVTCVIGTGTVVDPDQLIQEMDDLIRKGVSLDGLLISDRAHLIMPYHRLIDRLEEAARGKARIGTTGKGIGPAYTDKVARLGLRFGDLLDEALPERLAVILEQKNRVLTRLYGHEPMEMGDLLVPIRNWAARLRPHIADTAAWVDRASREGRDLIFEGAQGALLDLDWGTYPYVTSSHPVAGGACLGEGIGPTRMDQVIGVVKAYTTRVGEGPMPTETDEANALLRERGKEYGTTTGRARRCGWFDAMVVRQAVRASGITGLAITKLDVLDELAEIPICVGYRIDGEWVTEFPSQLSRLAKAEPVYEIMPGWKSSTAGIQERSALPREAVAYLERISQLLGVPILLVSTGPERDSAVKEALVA